MTSRRVGWETRSFAGSLGLLTGILALVVCCLIVLTLESASVLSSVRAYVGVEGLWSRGEKDAVYALRRYAVTRDEADWAAYQAAIAVPLADREAREQLERPTPDMERVRAGFIGGRNHPDDVARMAMLFRTFRHVSYIDRAVSIWSEADDEITRLASLADLLHGLVTQGQTWPGKVDSVLGEIDEANRRLTVLEDRFSSTLGEGARWLESLLHLIVVGSALVLLAGAALLTARVLARIRDSHERYHQLLATARDAFFITDVETGVVLEANRSAGELVGVPVGELIGRRLEELHPAEERVALRELMAGTGRPGSLGEGRIVAKDGRLVPIEIAVSVTELGDRRIAASSYRDVSARRTAEQALRDRDEQLRHSQKMEAVGELAGGVAHDFNNLLTAILGYSELLLGRLNATDPLRHAAEQIQRAADRAAGLTRQLLAFSRRQVMEPRVLDLNAITEDTEQMLRRLIGEDIHLITVRSPGIGRIRADRTQLEQVLINLVLNARDAMPAGGVLTVETDEVEVLPSETRPGLSAGRWVRLVVRDTGHGMDEPTIERIFEPFFTTKQRGRGTGLGLAMVDGIVRQSGGHIEVDSALHQGATFHVFFPRVEGEPEAEAPRVAEPTPLPLRGTVLLAEDEDAVRDLARDMLTLAGFEVLEARDGEHALEVAAVHGGSIALLLTDVVMPRMNGRELAEALALRQPGLRVLFMSGYPDDDVMRRTGLAAGERFLAKPFLPTTLVERVCAAMNAPAFAPAPDSDPGLRAAS